MHGSVGAQAASMMSLMPIDGSRAGNGTGALMYEGKKATAQREEQLG